MIKKSIALFVCIVLLTMAAAGCWNYTDIDSQFVVLGVVIDYIEETKDYVMTAEIAKAKGGTNAELITRVESFEGSTLFEATRNAIKKVGAKLYWGHTMFYAFSERVAREGIADVFSIVWRQTQMRSDMFIFIVDDDSVENFFKFDDPIHESVSQHIHDLVKASEASGKFRSTPFYKILGELESEEVSLILPIMLTKEEEEEEAPKQSPDSSQSSSGSGSSSGSEQQGSAEEQSKKIVLLVDGSSVFKGDKTVGNFSELDTRCAMILKGELKENFIIAYEEKGEIPSTSVEVVNSKAEMKARIDKNNRLNIDVTYELEGDLVELQTQVDFISDGKKGILEQGYNELLQEQFILAFNKAQELKSDVFGIAGIVHRNDPDTYKEIKDNWDTVFQNAIVNVDVKLTITSSSLAMGPIKVGS